METLAVVFSGVTWAAKDKDEDGLIWGIYRVEDSTGKRVVIKGKLDECMMNKGMVFNISGRWERDKKYGLQFSFNNFSRKQPNGMWGTIAFIMQADGIGETIAERIYTKYGEQAIQNIIDQPDTVAARIEGLRVDVATEASKKLAPLVNESKLKLPLLSLFKGTKLPTKTANRVINARIPDPVNKLSENPFLLMQFKGIAFRQADSLRIKLKLSPDMPERIQAACLQTFSDESDQTWLDEAKVTSGMSKLLEAPDVNAKQDLETLERNGSIVSLADGGKMFYAEERRAKDELDVALALDARLNSPPPQWLYDKISAIDTSDDNEITEHQKEVLLHNVAAGGRVLVLPGSPGTGKTYTLGRLLSLFREYHACAPTGKAAQRLTQSLKGKQVATTIHRMLEPKPISGGGFVFSLQNGEVDFDVVAVDEASMVNNELAAALFRGLSENSYLVLVGDQNQLPPVGPGTMLRDLQSTGKFKELVDIERNSGMIVHSCAAIREMKTPRFHMTPAPGTNVETDKNVHLAMAAKDENKMDWIRKVCNIILEEGVGSKGNQTRSIQDIQFITATHRNPHVGREALNVYLQQRFNPAGRGQHYVFKMGDKVICTENCFLSPVNGGEKVFVANGDLGVVVQSWEKRITVRITSTGDEVMVPCGKDANGWDLGYAITCHKFQGSEAPICIVAMGSDYGSEMVMSREWLYTALSRAKECCVLVCGPGQVASQIRKVRIHDRKSWILKYWEEWNGETEETKGADSWLDADHRQQGTGTVEF